MSYKINTTIIIVNWNGQHLLGDCLQSLQKQTYQNFNIALVDNGSVDGSVDCVRENFSKVKIIELTENTGFAKGNNIGISVALQNEKIENVILLNNDTKVEKDFVEKLVEYQKRQRGKSSLLKAGALAPKMLLAQKEKFYADDKSDNGVQAVIDSVGARVGLDGRGYSVGHGEIDKGQYDKSQEVFGFCGGAVLLKRKALEDIAGQKINKQIVRQDLAVEYQEYFDDNFFAYYEDADLSCRMRLRGWKTVTVPSAVVHHLHSATADTIKSKTFKAYYLNRNRFLMMLKNYPKNLLWRGMLQVPKSYLKFKETEEEQKNIKKSNNQSKIVNTIKNKIRMIGVMTKVIFSLLFNLSKIISQRRRIQDRILVKENNFEKWLW